jgi:hypothetical protein
MKQVKGYKMNKIFLTLILAISSLHISNTLFAEQQEYPHENVVYLDNNYHGPKPCSEFGQFFQDVLEVDISPDDLCWTVVYTTQSKDENEPVFNLTTTDRQYTTDLNYRSYREIYPHGLLSGDKMFAERRDKATTDAEREAIEKEWGEAMDKQYQNQRRGQLAEPLPRGLRGFLPDKLIADKKEGDILNLTVHGVPAAIRCVQRYFRLNMREHGYVRNPRFEQYREFLLKRHRGELPSDDEITERGGWPFVTTGYESYLFGWRRWFTSQAEHDEIHKKHYTMRWED